MSVVGQKIPHMQLKVDGDQVLELSKDILGKWSLIYIYPKDDTPGCTKQACGYRDNSREFLEMGVRVFGLSADDIESHEAFVSKYSLNFPLISDPDKKLATFFGSYGEQEWNGKKFMGLSRDTFLMDPQGVVQKEWRKVDASTTVQTTFLEVKKFMTSL